MLIENVLSFADEFDMFPESGAVLACVSGGADSMCLLEVLLEISRMRGFTVGAAHYNHMLRGDESDRDEAFVRQYCESRSVPFYSGGGDVRSYAKENGLGIEEAARDLRYDFFYATASGTGAMRIATAHNADDNAETLLINLARGAGAAGLSGIPPKRQMANGKGQSANGNAKWQSVNCKGQMTNGNGQMTNGKGQSSENTGVTIIRPMLCVSRDEILGFINERGIPFVVDSTNDLDIYTRNKLRRTVIPVFMEINPRFSEAAAATAALSRADEEYLSGLAGQFINAELEDEGSAGLESAPSVGVDELLALPFAISGRVIRRLYGGNLSYDHVKAVLEMCKRGGPSARLSLPGMTVRREYGRIVFGGAAAADGFKPVYLTDGRRAAIPGLGLEISCKSVICSDIINPACGRINKSFTYFLFKSADVCGKISVRSRREGDTIRLHGQSCSKTLKKLFIERRIPARERSLVPVVADERGVLAVFGLGQGDRAVPSPGDFAFQVEFKEKNDNDD